MKIQSSKISQGNNRERGDAWRASWTTGPEGARADLGSDTDLDAAGRGQRTGWRTGSRILRVMERSVNSKTSQESRRLRLGWPPRALTTWGASRSSLGGFWSTVWGRGSQSPVAEDMEAERERELPPWGPPHFRMWVDVKKSVRGRKRACWCFHCSCVSQRCTSLVRENEG